MILAVIFIYYLGYIMGKKIAEKEQKQKIEPALPYGK